MKRTICIIIIFLLVFGAVAVSIVACDKKSRNARLGLRAMEEGDYDRARRLYNFAVEKNEADAEDREIYEVLCAYTDADRALKSEDFAGGLEILDACKADYSSMPIGSDMDLLRNRLSDGKYADERMNTLESMMDDGSLERVRDMVVEISRLSLTTAQRSRLEGLSRKISELLSEANPENYYVYNVKGSSSSTIPMYYEASEESEIICNIPGGEPVEARTLADNGFIMIVYNGETGYVKASDIVPANSESENRLPEIDESDETDKDDEKDDGGEKNGDKDGDTDKNAKDDEDEKTPVEAISANDSLFAIMAVNLRSEPNTDCEVIDTIPAGTEVVYLGEMEHGFYKVRYNGTVGYAYSDYLQSSN